MAEAITIACPECEKKITVAAEAVGKKIRCKGCEHIFVIEAPGAKKAASKPAGQPAAVKAAGAKKAPDGKAKPAKPKDDEDEENSNPYGITSLDTSHRCPDCANELESEDAIVCLNCGYNTRTREKAMTRAVEDTTGGTWFWWLLPGILCALATLLLFTFDLWYSLKIGQFVDVDNDWYAFVAHQGFIIWLVWAPTIIVMVGTTAFAVRRLILNPRPPERLKKKKVK